MQLKKVGSVTQTPLALVLWAFSLVAPGVVLALFIRWVVVAKVRQQIKRLLPDWVKLWLIERALDGKK
jgi:hypothetical protein